MGLINQEEPYAVFEALARLGEHARRHGERHRRQHRPTSPGVDPTIETAAQSLAAEAWAEVNRLRMAGNIWYVAREKALAPRLRIWNRTYGSKCAARAHQIVLSLDPASAPAHVLRHERHELVRLALDCKIKRGKRVTWLDRLCLRLFGLPFSG
jgi:hypothetical protein